MLSASCWTSMILLLSKSISFFCTFLSEVSLELLSYSIFSKFYILDAKASNLGKIKSLPDYSFFYFSISFFSLVSAFIFASSSLI